MLQFLDTPKLCNPRQSYTRYNHVGRFQEVPEHQHGGRGPCTRPAHFQHTFPSLQSISIVDACKLPLGSISARAVQRECFHLRRRANSCAVLNVGPSESGVVLVEADREISRVPELFRFLSSPPANAAAAADAE